MVEQRENVMRIIVDEGVDRRRVGRRRPESAKVGRDDAPAGWHGGKLRRPHVGGERKRVEQHERSLWWRPAVHRLVVARQTAVMLEV